MPHSDACTSGILVMHVPNIDLPTAKKRHILTNEVAGNLKNIDLTARENSVAINEEANTAVAGTIKWKFMFVF